jgi:hypothetical protein
MRLALALTVVLLGGCRQVVSIHPLSEPKQTACDPALLGVWKEKDGSDLLTVRAGQKADHCVASWLEKDEIAAFEVRLFQVKDVRLADIVAAKTADTSIPAHLLVKVSVEGSTLRLALLSPEWADQEIREGRFPAHQVLDGGDRIVITAPPAELAPFVARCAAEPKAFDKPEEFRRVE